MNEQLTNAQIQESIQKGIFQPHIYLTNLCLAFFQSAAGFISRRLFPIVPVPLSTAKFYEFDKGDLTRLGVGRKPEFGHVAPTVFGKLDHSYDCKVDQVITGIDRISAVNFQRTNAPGPIDPRRGKARFVAEQMNLHLDVLWANKYFNPASWTHVYEGTDTTPTGNQFWYFDNDNCDPVQLFYSLTVAMRMFGLRKPNKIGIGMNAHAKLKTNPAILERIKYQGSEANPANVTENVLAQLFGVDEYVVAESVVNKAPMGKDNDLQFVCDPNSLLLCYTTNAPAIEEPSAGYTFAWDMLGNGQYIAMQQYQGNPASHTDFMEGLLSTDHQIAAPDLGVFLKNCVSPANRTITLPGQ
ncbi:MAG: hypothetical protein FWB91_00150 [Defluviitaleaceae bacterium]|nr:hypothetical protein [Defluviitaleaceae bacterium]